MLIDKLKIFLVKHKKTAVAGVYLFLMILLQ
jgi:hypothetical protein